MKKVIIMKLVKPPDMAAFISSGPSRERNTLSVNVITVSQACETTMGMATTSNSRTPPARGVTSAAEVPGSAFGMEVDY